MRAAQLRQLFLDFFKHHGHTLVPSSSLIPVDDQTLLFTNSGMVQFKDVFLGSAKRSYTRATSSQRCVRAGGKHNDLENVGFTARHHTFFEMLGNFSFGDYFKRDAIRYAFEFVTVKLGLPIEKLWITVHTSDQEAEDIWINEIGISPAQLSRCGDKDNFWSMGDVGPCGPCSEIFYDHGPNIAGGPPGSPDADGDRYIEIWNLVFMQFNRDAGGKLTKLPKPSVDTGMGLERVAAILQGKHNNYDIDIFQNIIKVICQVLNISNNTHASVRVIADHLRSASFLIVDGIIPSNEGRGYVLRRIIRRALRHAQKLGCKEVFFSKLVAVLVENMCDAYPELITMQRHIEDTLQQEELQFSKTLIHGLRLFDEACENLSNNTLTGEIIFKLYDTYGFPTDLTADIARERNIEVDLVGFEIAMHQQRERARASNSFTQTMPTLHNPSVTEFLGYETLQSTGKILEIINEVASVTKLQAGDKAILTLTQTTFYGESGGQVGDIGYIYGNEDSVFKVTDTKKIGSTHVHYGVLISGSLSVEQSVRVEVDLQHRNAIAANHSATHLLHAALHKIVGPQVSQKGSIVDAERLRFDVAHQGPISFAILTEVERLVNTQIRLNTAVTTQLLSIEDAKLLGAVALFGEKYHAQVRVLTMGNSFSIELCGGTHVTRTGDIGLFKIVLETGVAAGVRRIEAITGNRALDWLLSEQVALHACAMELKTLITDLPAKVNALVVKLKATEKELASVQQKLASGNNATIEQQITEINGIKVLATVVDSGDVKALRMLMDSLKNKLQTAIVVLAAVEHDKITLLAGVTKDCIHKINAAELVNMVASQVGGSGGGKPDLAQAGGNLVQYLPQALASVSVWVKGKL
jgi:alanyl-tRNA synthetase